MHEGSRLVKKFRAESDERKPYSVNRAPIGANILQGDNKNTKPVITKRRNGTTENKNPNGPRGVLKRKILEESLLRPLFPSNGRGEMANFMELPDPAGFIVKMKMV